MLSGDWACSHKRSLAGHGKSSNVASSLAVLGMAALAMLNPGRGSNTDAALLQFVVHSYVSYPYEPPAVSRDEEVLSTGLYPGLRLEPGLSSQGRP